MDCVTFTITVSTCLPWELFLGIVPRLFGEDRVHAIFLYNNTFLHAQAYFSAETYFSADLRLNIFMTFLRFSLFTLLYFKDCKFFCHWVETAFVSQNAKNRSICKKAVT